MAWNSIVLTRLTTYYLAIIGHGGRIRDDNWDEEKDGYDETIVPLDYDTAGQIRDDDLNACLVEPMAPGVSLVALMDCCHSGTVLDLPYTFRADGAIGNLFADGEVDFAKIEQAAKGDCAKLAKCLCIFVSVFLLIGCIVVGSLFLTVFSN